MTDLKAYRALRLHVIESSPSAFTSSVAEEKEARDDRLLADIAPTARGCVMGAFYDHVLVGVAGLRAEQKQQASHKGVPFGMAVRPRAQGRGVGRALVEAILREARELGLLQVVLTCSEGNAPAEHLYRSCGFMEFGREPRAVIVDDAHIVKVHMIRRLGGSEG
jgi:GNAT superfamily N-acetyltransferase